MLEMKSIEGATKFAIKFHRIVEKPYTQSVVIRNWS